MKRWNVNRIMSICLVALMVFSSLDMSAYATELPTEAVEKSITYEDNMIPENEEESKGEENDVEGDLAETSLGGSVQDNSVETEIEHEHNYTYEYFDEMYHTVLCQSCEYSSKEKHDKTEGNCEKCKYQQK